MISSALETDDSIWFVLIRVHLRHLHLKIPLEVPT